MGDRMPQRRSYKTGAERRDSVGNREDSNLVARQTLDRVPATLTPSLSQGEREACGANSRSPLPEGEGQGEGVVPLRWPPLNGF